MKRKEIEDLINEAVQDPLRDFIDELEGDVTEARDMLETALDSLNDGEEIKDELEEAYSILKNLSDRLY